MLYEVITERLVLGDKAAEPQGGLTLAMLAKSGFLGYIFFKIKWE